MLPYYKTRGKVRALSLDASYDMVAPSASNSLEEETASIPSRTQSTPPGNYFLSCAPRTIMPEPDTLEQSALMVRGRSNSDFEKFSDNFFTEFCKGDLLTMRPRGFSESQLNLCSLPIVPYVEPSELEIFGFAINRFDAAKCSAMLTANPDLEYSARVLLKEMFKSCKDSGVIPAFDSLLQAISLRAETLFIWLQFPDLPGTTKTIILFKILNLPDATLQPLAKIFDLKKIIKTVSDPRQKELLQNKLKVSNDAAHPATLIYFCQTYGHDQELLRAIVQAFLSRIAAKCEAAAKPIFIEPEYAAGKVTYMHTLLEYPDTEVDSVYRILSVLFDERELGGKFSQHFASALLLKNRKGISPLQMLEDKGPQWHEITKLLKAQLIRFLQMFATLDDAEWEAIFADKEDVFNNKSPTSKIILLFDGERYTELARLIDWRYAFRMEVCVPCLDAIMTSKLLAAKRKTLDDYEPCRNRLKKLFGYNEYMDKLRGELPLRTAIALAATMYSGESERNPRAKEKQEEADIFDENTAYKHAMRYCPVTETIPWKTLAGMVSKEPENQEALETLVAILQRYVEFFGLDIDQPDEKDADDTFGETALYMATFAFRHLALVKILCEEFKATITGDFLLLAAAQPELFANGIFEFLYTRYLAQKTQDPQLPWPDELVDVEGCDIIFKIIFLAKSISGLKFILDNGYKPKHLYINKEVEQTMIQQSKQRGEKKPEFNESDKENILVKLCIGMAKGMLDVTVALPMAQVLLDNPEIATTLVRQKSRKYFTALICVVLSMSIVDPPVICALIDLLIKKGSRLDIRMEAGSNLIHACVSHTSLEVIDFVLQQIRTRLGEDEMKSMLNQPNAHGIAPLDVANNISAALYPMVGMSAGELRELHERKIKLLECYGATKRLTPEDLAKKRANVALFKFF